MTEPLQLRKDDTREDPSWRDIVNLRRVRQTDNGDDALAIQAQRCLRQFKAYSFRTTVTIVTSVGVMLGSATYVYINDSTEKIYKEMGQHVHTDLVQHREIDQLRVRILDQLNDIGVRLRELRDHQQRSLNPRQ